LKNIAFSWTALVIVSVLLSACDLDRPYIDCEYPNYSNCETVEPLYGRISVSLSFNDQNSRIPLVVFYGQPENNNICLVDTVSKAKIEYFLPLNMHYTLKATYMSNNKIIHAFDGGFLEKKSYNVCDSICWVVKTLELDLKLDK